MDAKILHYLQSSVSFNTERVSRTNLILVKVVHVERERTSETFLRIFSYKGINLRLGRRKMVLENLDFIFIYCSGFLLD